jgi:hypothetical protein
MRRLLAAAILAVLAWPSAADNRPEARLYTPDGLKWEDGPKSLPKGAKMVVLEGDPNAPGPFVLRLKVPDGYKIPPHVHPKPERLTVISGSFHFGMGDKFDAKHATALPAGSFGTWPAGMRHFVWCEGETVVQLHGDGPWQIEYLNPLDDPRRPTER